MNARPPNQPDIGTLVVFVNGKKMVVKNPDPECTLVQFLRLDCGLTGTKIGCNQGQCGACTVMVSWHDGLNKVSHLAVNACLVPLVSLHGHAITTVEGIGSTETKLHPVQMQLANSNGTQCGFCSPGMVMSMYTLLRNTQHPSAEQIEDSLVGNLCRCTGYRPILDGFQAFSSEDGCPMGDDCCKNNAKPSQVESKGSASKKPPSESSRQQDVIFPPELKLTDYLSQAKCFKGERVTWYTPTKVSNLFALRQQHPDAIMVCGNTFTGVGTKLRKGFQPVVISISQIPELGTILHDHEPGFWMGATVTISQLESALRKEVERLPQCQSRLYRSLLDDVLKLFASSQIKNVASLAGNLLLSSGVSDIKPLLLVAEVTVKLMSSKGTRTVPLSSVMSSSSQQPNIRDDEIVEAIFLPRSTETEYFRSYKQAVRKSMSSAIVNAGMKVKFDKNIEKVVQLTLAYGGLESVHPKVLDLSQQLTERLWDDKLLEDVLQELTNQLDLLYPAVNEPSVVYKKALVHSFFYKFYVNVQEWMTSTAISKPTEKTFSTEPSYIPRKSMQISAENTTDQSGDCWKALPHRAAPLHCTGEAQYVDDLPQYKGELHMAFVHSKVAHANILSTDTSKALASPGVAGYLSADDVPAVNDFGMAGDPELIFNDKKVTCVGQIIGAIVADTRAHAQIAAELVKVEYEKLPAIFTIEQAIQAESYYGDKPMTLWKGNAESALSSAEDVIEGDMKVGGQEHFYMETQVSLAVPKENGEMEMFSATQNPAGMQSTISKVLGVSSNRINVRVKRLGGGFGGKQSRSYLVALPVAVAAHKFKVPVRCYLDREDDMAITGNRDPFYAKYKVGFNKDSNIIALDIQLFSNGGCAEDVSMAVMSRGVLSVDNAYNIANMRVRGRVCMTNTPNNAACRGLAGPQAILVIENIISEISTRLGVPTYKIQLLNMYGEGDVTHFGQPLIKCTLSRCYQQVLVKSEYESRQVNITSFNRENEWRKRGLAIAPAKYGISFDMPFLNQAGALVHIYSDGNVLIAHGGTEMGQGLHTKVIQIASTALGIDSEKIYLQETSTSSVANGIVTGSSTATDLNGAAIKNACLELQGRLEPFKSAAPDASWEKWVSAAYMARVSLSATGFYSTPGLVQMNYETSKGSPYAYFVYGAAVSEVEIDCLTGHHQVLRTDIVMDVGQSLNPDIDIGQIEGAFIQGYGLFCLEEIKFDSEGKMTSAEPSSYKIPAINNIPREFKVTLLEGSTNEKAVYSSKAVGEPPLCLSTTTFLAVKAAVQAARIDSGRSSQFPFNSPCTVENIRLSCSDIFTDRASGST